MPLEQLLYIAFSLNRAQLSKLAWAEPFRRKCQRLARLFDNLAVVAALHFISFNNYTVSLALPES
ncbi:MAG: hypothetical protein C5B53_03260 [Candidatus Melainabacteria bacterium]|nr:MAG: hypothetical protein C5B53_03260 [Candidatus Melainabacteria bacterium]